MFVSQALGFGSYALQKHGEGICHVAGCDGAVAEDPSSPAMF